MSMTDLSVEILPGFRLSDPLMIASSHWTSTENSFRRLAEMGPSAVTLKTTSSAKGGDGKEAMGSRRDKRSLEDSYGHTFAYYSDGPPTVELWDLPTTYAM